MITHLKDIELRYDSADPATVVEPLPNAMFRVELENKHKVLAAQKVLIQMHSKVAMQVNNKKRMMAL